jgi:hypothetical protein
MYYTHLDYFPFDGVYVLTESSPELVDKVVRDHPCQRPAIQLVYVEHNEIAHFCASRSGRSEKKG